VGERIPVEVLASSNQEIVERARFAHCSDMVFSLCSNQEIVESPRHAGTGSGGPQEKVAAIKR
jgi:hypothetical protein